MFKRGNSWYCDFATPGGKRIKKSLGTSDKKQAQELHDKLKAEQWRIEQVGDFPDYTYEEACLRWLEEKADKKSIEDDKNFITFWLEYFEGVRLKDITENAIYKIISKMTNKHAENCWRRKADTAKRKGKEVPLFTAKPVTTATKARYLSFIKALLRAAEREWKWIEKSPVIKIPSIRDRRVRWLEPVEAKRLIDECPEPLKSVVRFALSTGLRRSNILN
ncbi:integrase, partial [Morganella morganii]